MIGTRAGPGQNTPMKSLCAVAVVIGCVLAACAPDFSRIPPPTEKMAMELGVAHAELVRGHATYMNHCSQCHERVPPGEIDPEFWRGVLPHMAVRSKITEVEEYELLLYLLAAHGTVHGLDLEH